MTLRPDRRRPARASAPRVYVRRASLFGLACVLLFTAACSGRRVPAPRLDPEEAGRLALADYDRNNDGRLDAAELERCPGLRGGLKTLDTDKDGRLNAQEIAARVTAYQNSRIGLMGVTCQVTLDGAPLVGASVELVPEKFLGAAVKPARGVSEKEGSVPLHVEGQDLPGVQCGVYRVVVSKKNAAGKELLPGRYNAKTTLGQEIGPDLNYGLRFDLVSP